MMENHISITTALSDAWERMQTILFRPFDLKKWMVLGFTAWLAGLAQGGSNFGWNIGGEWESRESELWSSNAAPAAEAEASNSGFVSPSSAVQTRPDWPDWPDWSHWGGWVLEHPLWFAVGALGCVSLLVLFVVILWLSSRGKFMFLDNVVHNRAEVVSSWNRYRRLGNSHLGFQLVFYGILLAAVLGAVLVGLAIASGSSLVQRGPAALGPVLLVVVLAVTLVAFTVAYIQYFLDAFVVPVMHRYDLGVLDAWRRFGTLFLQHPWVFLLSGPFLLLLGLAAVLLVFVAGLLTCCIGLILVIIPYIGTVILLPIHVTYRGFTVALLDQMEPGYFPDTTMGERDGAAAA